jgi:nicotinate phosphoribosyltransferase
MAHSFIQSYDNELSAFRDFAAMRPEQCVLLVDTYDTLRSGIPNAIIIAREMEQQSTRLQGIRLTAGTCLPVKAGKKNADDVGRILNHRLKSVG